MPSFESPYFAAIDLGSNSFHMLVVRFNGDKIDIIDREKEMVQIARGMKPNGTLDEAAQKRALDCLARFSERIHTIPKSQVRAVGTKALRAARNSSKILRQAEKVLNVPIQIISGYEEARLVYTGLSHTVINEEDQRLVIDIGGGSTEFIIGKNYAPICMESLALGCVTYSDKFTLRESDITAQKMCKAYLSACGELEEIRRNYLKQGWKIAYGTSGTMKAIADLLAETDGGAIISKKSLNDYIKHITELGHIESETIPKLRKDVLAGGLAILQAIFDELKLEQIHVANATLKEGLVYDTIGRFSDHDARIETVEHLINQYHIDRAQADRVKKTALTFWQQIEGPELPGVSRTKILSWAAQMHEIGLSISHASFHHHGYYILRHADLAGFGRYEQYILANLIRSHRKKLNPNRFEDMDNLALSAFIPLLICLRLAARLHRHREDLEELPGLTLANSLITLTFAKGWLSEHPLTMAGLEEEILYFQTIELTLLLNEQS